jgi:acetyl-CoA acetyltransferase
VTDAVLVAAVRTPVGKAPHGQLRHMRPDDLAALVIRAALDRVPGLDPATVDDASPVCTPGCRTVRQPSR